jgi:hypothetical protein
MSLTISDLVERFKVKLAKAQLRLLEAQQNNDGLTVNTIEREIQKLERLILTAPK